LLSRSNDQAVVHSGGVVVSLHILEVGGIVGTWMLLNGLEDTNSTDVVSSEEHNSGTTSELNDGIDFTGGEVDLF